MAIRLARELDGLGMTWEELGREVGASREAVERMKAGEKPYPLRAVRVARAVGWAGDPMELFVKEGKRGRSERSPEMTNYGRIIRDRVEKYVKRVDAANAAFDAKRKFAEENYIGDMRDEFIANAKAERKAEVDGAGRDLRAGVDSDMEAFGSMVDGAAAKPMGPEAIEVLTALKMRKEVGDSPKESELKAADAAHGRNYQFHAVLLGMGMGGGSVPTSIRNAFEILRGGDVPPTLDEAKAAMGRAAATAKGLIGADAFGPLKAAVHAKEAAYAADEAAAVSDAFFAAYDA